MSVGLPNYILTTFNNPEAIHSLDFKHCNLNKLNETQWNLFCNVLIKHLAASKELQSLNLADILHHMTKQQLMLLRASLASCQNLQKLSLSSNHLAEFNEEKWSVLCNIIASCKWLISLALGNNKFDALPEKRWQDLRLAFTNCRKLTYLNFESDLIVGYAERNQYRTACEALSIPTLRHVKMDHLYRYKNLNFSWGDLLEDDGWNDRIDKLNKKAPLLVVDQGQDVHLTNRRILLNWCASILSFLKPLNNNQDLIAKILDFSPVISSLEKRIIDNFIQGEFNFVSFYEYRKNRTGIRYLPLITKNGLQCTLS